MGQLILAPQASFEKLDRKSKREMFWTGWSGQFH
jgi:hypothetical protein